jgi:prepilin-type N-terminal cleavage/methylation domain-containing protein
MRYLLPRSGFTLIEMMLVVVMIGIVAAGVFYMGGPYINRSRDVARFADLSQYSRVISLYEQENDALPSTIDPTNTLLSSYCAEEVFFERESGSGKDMQFTYLRELMFSKPTRDPLKSTPAISPCTRT